MNLRGRLARLERERRGRRRCPGCGWREGDAVEFDIPMPRVIGSPPDPDDGPSLDTCGSCGRRVVFRVPSPQALAAAP